MIIFDQLRISDNGGMLYIDAHVNLSDYFSNIYIDRVVIQTQDQVSEMDPLSPGDSYIYNQQLPDNTKEIHLALKAETDFESVLTSLSDSLLFVYIVCRGIPDPCVPCRLDEMTTLGVTFDTTLLYQKVMQHTKQLADTCKVAKGFIDLILLWNGFKAAIETEHYIQAIDFWKRLFDNKYGIGATPKPCGCHG